MSIESQIERISEGKQSIVDAIKSNTNVGNSINNTRINQIYQYVNQIKTLQSGVEEYQGETMYIRLQPLVSNCILAILVPPDGESFPDANILCYTYITSTQSISGQDVVQNRISTDAGDKIGVALFWNGTVYSSYSDRIFKEYSTYTSPYKNYLAIRESSSLPVGTKIYWFAV